MVTSETTKPATAKPQTRVNIFASVKLTIVMMSLIGATILIGAWCPQEGQGGKEKVVEAFGPVMAKQLIDLGIADIYHSPFFLGLIGVLTINMIVASAQRVFPKVPVYMRPMVFIPTASVKKLVVSHTVPLEGDEQQVRDRLFALLKKLGFTIRTDGNRFTAEWGKYGRLAASVTHVGLLTLLAGVTVTSWTGFTGFQPVMLGENMSFAQSEHSKLWIGSLPKWQVHVDATRKESYESGDPKQWYSTLSIIGEKGQVLKTQEISVNNPLSYDGVDIYQSSWGLGDLVLAFNGRDTKLPLRQMGAVSAAFMPLDEKTIMIFSVRGEDQPIRVFAKIPEWKQPRLLSMIQKGKPTRLGSVDVTYERLTPITGLQYKRDPGLPIVYVAFGFIMCGVLLAAIPHRQIWGTLEPQGEGTNVLTIGGASRKAKGAFAKICAKLVNQLEEEFKCNEKEAELCPISS